MNEMEVDGVVKVVVFIDAIGVLVVCWGVVWTNDCDMVDLFFCGIEAPSWFDGVFGSMGSGCISCHLPHILLRIKGRRKTWILVLAVVHLVQSHTHQY